MLRREAWTIWIKCTNHKALRKRSIGDQSYILDLAFIASLAVWRKLNPIEKLSEEDNRAFFNIARTRELVRPDLERRKGSAKLVLIFEIHNPHCQHHHKLKKTLSSENRKRCRCHRCIRQEDKRTLLCSICNRSASLTIQNRKQFAVHVNNLVSAKNKGKNLLYCLLVVNYFFPLSACQCDGFLYHFISFSFTLLFNWG